MPRTLTAHFKAAAASKTAKPYQVLQIDWSTGTKYYLDRPSNSFSASGARIPSSNVDASVQVLQWPSVSISLKEGQIGSTDQTTIILDDAAGALTTLLSSAAQQRRLISVWRMFDDPTVVWGTDNALMFTGCLRPFDWSAKDNQITLNVGDLGPLLGKSISFRADQAIFPNVPPEYQDKQLPVCCGLAQRVEAICVQRPWQTVCTQQTTSTDANITSATFTIRDDPNDMGVDGTGATQYNALWCGRPVTATFLQSATPRDGTSTATIAPRTAPYLAKCLVLQTVDGSGNLQIVTNSDHVTAIVGTPFTLDQTVQTAGDTFVYSGGAQVGALRVLGVIPHQPFQDNLGIQWYVIVIDPTGFIPSIGHEIRFAENSLDNPIWDIPPGQSGYALQEDGKQSIYIANALPSKNIVRVEGYGKQVASGPDMSIPRGGSGFIALGSYRATTVSGLATTALTGSSVVSNLNDNKWNNPAGTNLGQNVTTITFPTTPSAMAPPGTSLDDDRIWVTLEGVEDIGNSTGNLITNPALVVLQYLQNAALMNVTPTSINMGSFITAATKMTSDSEDAGSPGGYSIGFAQVEATDGLSLLQHIANLAHSVLFFDQGQANLVVLSDSPGAIIATFDTTTHDNILQGSLTVSESAVDDVINDWTFKWRPYWDDKTGQKLLDVKDANLSSIAAFGAIAKESTCDTYWRRSDVFAELTWWLAHSTNIFRYVKFTAFLDALILQPGDWISVTWIDGGGRNLFGGAQTMMVTKTTDTGKDGLVDIEARFVQFSFD